MIMDWHKKALVETKAGCCQYPVKSMSDKDKKFFPIFTIIN